MKPYTPEENKYLIENWHMPVKTLGRYLKRSPNGVRSQIKRLKEEGDVVPNNLPPVGNPYGRRGKKPPIKCIEDGCENWQHGKSLCKKHYEYKRRRGLIDS